MNPLQAWRQKELLLPWQRVVGQEGSAEPATLPSPADPAPETQLTEGSAEAEERMLFKRTEGTDISEQQELVFSFWHLTPAQPITAQQPSQATRPQDCS